MTTTLQSRLLVLLLMLMCALPAVPAPDKSHDEADEQDWTEVQRPDRFHERWRQRHSRGGNDLVSIGHDSLLPAGQTAETVVAVFGSSTSEGTATDVVSVFGDNRITGTVSDTAVSVLGNTYIDGKVSDVVTVVGNVQLGPNAEVDGDVVVVLGSLSKDPAAVIHGGVRHIIDGSFGDLAWLHTWVRHCLLYGRPLALVAGIGWAWTWAIGALAFYCLLALLFPTALTRCVRTMETEPGRTALAALVTALLTPVLLVLLCITLIGIAAVPFVAAALLCAVLFGKTVVLAWIGDRATARRFGPDAPPAIAVAVGGALVLLMYLVPVLGFLLFQLLGFFGLGAVVYTLIADLRLRQANKIPRTRPSPATAEPPPAADAPAASAARPFVSASMPRAGFWVRMGALCIDVVLVGIVLRLLHPFGHFHLVVLAAYGAVMWKLRGSTIGGRVFDLQVVRLDGREFDWETSIVRALGCFLSLAVAGLGFIWIAFDEKRQAWHDKIAGTVVVRVPSTPGG
jgi:uncharacterized RDD family membrane protein YckC